MAEMGGVIVQISVNTRSMAFPLIIYIEYTNVNVKTQRNGRRKPSGARKSCGDSTAEIRRPANHDIRHADCSPHVCLIEVRQPGPSIHNNRGIDENQSQAHQATQWQERRQGKPAKSVNPQSCESLALLIPMHPHKLSLYIC